MDANPTRHILVNTMRSSFPAPKETGGYKMMVENEKQREEMMEVMPELLKYLRDTLANDTVEIEVELNQGEASPHTWNERQVLAHILEHNPSLKGFMDDFKLTIG